MSGSVSADSGRLIGPRGIGFLVAATLFTLAVVAGWFARRPSRSDFRLAAESPYRNVRPGVKYVGDAACVRCHAEITETYREHPMGRSLAEVRSMTIPGLDSLPSPLFTAQGLEYAVERRGDRVFHKEIKRDAGGKIVAQSEAEARYVIGSGEQAMAFLLERGDGYLFESPITWYSRKQKWDLSPGYEKGNAHFDRFVKPTCLFCHANQFDHVEGTENRYREPIFRGHAIGCERCHGPGELHVRKPELVKSESPNIVNPARLKPELREAVCQQCHLQGDIRIVRDGRKLTDFRPGLPLSSIESVFVKVAADGKTRFFGQVEQMQESRCYRESRGKMGCISCHDPHELPEPSRKAAYYRERCLNCHAEKGCTLPERERLTGGREDRCIDCHMPSSPNDQVPHTATTLHNIPRFKDRPEPDVDPGMPPGDRGVPLVHFHHRDLIDESERPAISRDLGIALVTINRALPGMTPAVVGRTALPLLEASLAMNPSDGPAWEARGSALWMLARREESLAALRFALKVSPNNEQALIAAGTRAAQMRKTEEALDHLGRAVAINPWRADYHLAIAMACFQGGRWDAAIGASRDALRLNPWDREARMIQIQCLLKVRRPREAAAELQTLLSLDPPDRDGLRAWYGRIQAAEAGQ